MISNFYRAFEDKYRGSRAVIKSRFQVYLPFIELLKLSHKNCTVVDLGCGRGEWLELLREVDIDARGVDVDDGMLAACRELGLNVETGDALNFLKSLPDESQNIVSGFHVIEHLPFKDLQILVQETLRVLKPAGLMILETPNPENIVVATSSFYLDPTHIHPIPHQLLAFLAEYYGFYRTKVLRLQESPELAAKKTPTLLDVLSGVSQDYAIVAQKNGPQGILAVFNQVFSEAHGLSLEDLANRYDMQIEQTVHDLAGVRADLVGVRAERDQLQAKLEKALADRENVRAELNKLTLELASKRVEAENFRREYVNILYSKSYRITAPLRALYLNLHKLRRAVRPEVQEQYINTPSKDLGVRNELGEDIQYFRELFQREITKRSE